VAECGACPMERAKRNGGERGLSFGSAFELHAAACGILGFAWGAGRRSRLGGRYCKRGRSSQPCKAPPQEGGRATGEISRNEETGGDMSTAPILVIGLP